MKFKDVGFVNRKIVGVNGDFQTIKQAVDWFNTNSSICTEVLIDAGFYPIDETIVVNKVGCTLLLRGTSSGTTIIGPTEGMVGKPLIEIYTNCDIRFLYLDGSNLENYGILSNEDAIAFRNDSGLKAEISDVQISNVYHGICDLYGVKLFVHDVHIHDCTVGVHINHINPNVESSYTDIFNITFEDCDVCVGLESAVSDKFAMDALHFIRTRTTCIKYEGDTYGYGDIATIINCVSDGSAPFITGVDFNLERDADIEMDGNIGYSSARPRAIAYYHAITPSYTTVTTAGTWYLIPLVMDDSFGIKTEFLPDSKARYFTHELRDTRHNVSGSLQQTGSIGRVISIGLRKNGTEILAYTRVRCRETAEPYAFTFFAFNKDTAYDDYFELIVTSDFSGDPVAIIDLQWHIDSV